MLILVKEQRRFCAVLLSTLERWEGDGGMKNAFESILIVQQLKLRHIYSLQLITAV